MSAALLPTSLASIMRFEWIKYVGAPIAFILAWGMGANELSSNWGNVFGSKVLKLWQIVLIAAIFEFIGAIALGSGVASTIRGSILSTSTYADNPSVLMFGMLCVLITASTWIYIANYFGLPISDSQTTVLSLIGVGLATKGWNAIRWNPGMSNIGIAWAVSPPSAMVISFLTFYIFKFTILKHADAVRRAKIFFPIFAFIILGVNIFFFIFETPAIDDNLTDGVKVGIALGAALVVTIIAQFTYFRWISKKVDEAEAAAAQAIAEAAAEKTKEAEGEMQIATRGKLEIADIVEVRKLDRVEQFLMKNRFTKFLVEDVQAAEISKDAYLTHVHEVADRYPVGVELMFTHLLIITACLKSFAHGASDVSNACGPLSAIVNILEDGKIDSQSSIPFWTLAVASVGMSVGILTYGYATLTMLGVRVTRISPVRGVCIDLAACIVIIVATYLKIPISTTQTTVFAIVGVGLATGIREKIHWANVGVIVTGWAVTLVFTALVSYSLTSFGVRAPTIV